MADKNNTALSLCVDKVLDHVGASELIRRNHVEKGHVYEVIMNLTLPMIYPVPCIDLSDARIHYFGSWLEGTTTKGLASDIDVLIYDISLTAAEEIPSGLFDGYLIINDGTTKPGYVKLQTVYNGIPITSVQGQRDCLRHTTVFLEMMKVTKDFKKVEQNGPAVTSSLNSGILKLDAVLAIRCHSIPSFSNGWICRHRKYGWPSKQQIDKMSTYGCVLVYKGHPSSQTEHLEWRISFSFQERELMLDLNSSQHKCYILLKMIKQYVISKTNTKTISSYHLKTALFYTIENNPTHIWIPDNLVYCTELCLKQLLDWLNSENCPNYFVPEENMFDRLSSDVMKMAATFIRDMLDSDGQYLMLLTCDKFGELLQESLSGKVLPNLSHDAIEFDLRNKMYLLPILASNRLVSNTDRNWASETLSAFKLLLNQLRQTEERLKSERVFREIKQGLDLLLPTIHLQIAQTIAAIMLTVTDVDKKRKLMQEFDHHIELADFYVLSQILVRASLMFKENNLEECVQILCNYEESSNANTLTTQMSPLEFLRKCETPCLMFLRSQADIAPTPLHYEMYRSVGADTDTVDPDKLRLYGAIAIDAIIYLFFLKYLVYSKLKKHTLAELTKRNLLSILRKCLNESPYLGHLETGFNLLGWICKQENDIQSAAICFLLSWQIRPDHNAAKWHMLVMMYEQYIQRSKKFKRGKKRKLSKVKDFI